jgi:hypothetical protein
VFGISSNVRQNIFFIDEQHIIYPCGSNMIMYNLEQKSQRFLPVSDHGVIISAITLSSNHKLLATCEKTKIPSITIIDMLSLRRKRSLSYPEGTIKVIIG